MIMHQDRILFLKQFTKELILQSKLPGMKKPEIEVPMIEEKLVPSMEIPEPEIKPKPQIQPIPIPLAPSPKPEYRVKLVSIKPPVRIQPIAAPAGLNLGKIDSLLRDPGITMIECPGPGKMVLVRSFGRTSSTKIVLSQDEIMEIIRRFSEMARIPVISGLFKAAVGSIIITAVISELVGNRFIITKVPPGFVEQVGKR